MSQVVLVLDFDGRYSKLVAQMVRGLSVYSEIKPENISAAEIRKLIR